MRQRRDHEIRAGAQALRVAHGLVEVLAEHLRAGQPVQRAHQHGLGLRTAFHRGDGHQRLALYALPHLQIQEDIDLRGGEPHALHQVQHVVDRRHGSVLAALDRILLPGDERAFAPGLADHARGFQVVVGPLDRAFRDAQFVGQLPHGGQLIAVFQLSFFDLPGDGARHLPVNGDVQVFVD